jgi:hypothetical protein
MAQFLPAQIDLFERQVESYAAHASDHAAAMLCYDVEELMSIYVSFFHEMEKAVRKPSVSLEWEKAVKEWSPLYRRLVRMGDRLRDLIRNLKAVGFEVAGLDPFMRALLGARVGADAEHNYAIISAVNQGKLPTRPVKVPSDELSARNDGPGGCRP